MRAFELTRSDGGKSILYVIDGRATLAAEIAKWESTANGVTITTSREMTADEIATHRTARLAPAAPVPTLAERVAALEGKR